jgi:two-component system cell cycle response regulator
MPLKILSVDDSKMIHSVIAKAFKTYNVELLFASNGVEGLAVATREKPDIIILDVTMPVMDGIETLTKLKTDPSLKDIPVIMLTAEAGKENVIKIARIGIRDYIIKPFTEQLVVERVSRIIDLQPKGATEVKVKSIEDEALIIVVEDKPAIIEQIKQSAGNPKWKVVGSSQCGEAIDITTKAVPDIILISLSLPEKGAFTFFQAMRGNPRTKSVPIFGLSVKTAIEEQNQAQSMGFNGIITKPLDVHELNHRLSRAMNLDTSAKYFWIEGDVQYAKIPNDPSTHEASEITAYISPKLRSMVDSGLNKLIIDNNEVTKISMTVIKLIIAVMQSARELGVKFRVIGSKDFATQAKAFEETKDMEIHESRDAAIASF